MFPFASVALQYPISVSFVYEPVGLILVLLITGALFITTLVFNAVLLSFPSLPIHFNVQFSPELVEELDMLCTFTSVP